MKSITNSGAKKIVIFANDGSVQWEFPAEMSRDVWRLTNGNILFCYNNQYDGSRGDNPSVSRIARIFSTTVSLRKTEASCAR